MKTALTFLVSLALLTSTACVTSHKTGAVLEFQDVAYTSLEGTPWPEKTAELPGTASRYQLGDGTWVRYVELNPKGETTLVFVHGLGSYLKFWRYQLDAFAEKGFRVVAVDLLGYGKSDKPATFPYTMEAQAQVLHEFFGVANIETPVLVGHSMGGQTALSYAIQYPEQLRALVLTSPAGFETFTPAEKAWFRRVFSTALVHGTSEYGIWGSVAEGNFASWKPEFEWLIQERVQFVGNRDFDRYAYANVRSVHGLLDNEFVRTNLDKVEVPTFIVHGDSDRLIPNRFLHAGFTREVMEVGRAGIPSATLVELAGCGHTVQMDCAPAYNAVVEKFLRAQLAQRQRHWPVTSAVTER
jgi:pimeloyl-ACP methyl ester carboxylesterase